MIKIKNNQTGDEKVIPAKYFFESDINLEEYRIIEWKDVVRVYTDRKNPVSLGIMSRLEAKKYLDSGTNYYLENVPRPDLKIEPVMATEQANIPAKQRSTKLSFIKDITLLGWAAICGLIALIIALWTIL
jgi:hypothetical protein